MNVWDALQTLRDEKNPRVFAMVGRTDALEIIALRDALIAILNGVTEKKLIHAKKLLGMQIK